MSEGDLVAAYTHSSLVKNVLKRLAAVLFGLLIAWLMLEVFLRVGFDFVPRGAQGVIQHVRRVPWSDEHIIPVFPWETSREYQARIPPNLKDYPVHWGDARFTFDTISLWDGTEGFRTNPPQWPVDVVAVGDSFTFCWTDFEDCWVEQLGTQFGWSVMNLGVPGTGSLSHRMVAGTYAVPLEPKVVVWQWYGNDYKDDYDHARIRGEVELLGGPPPLSDAVPDYGKFAEYSAVYRLLRDWLDRTDENTADKEVVTTINGREVLFNKRLGSHDLRYEMVQYGWDRTRTSIEETQAIVDDIGAELVIVLIPTKEEVYARWSEALLGKDLIDYLVRGRTEMLALCAEENWRCLDVTDAFVEAVNQGQTVYNGFDFHLDATGNQILARLLGEYLIEQGILAR